MKFILPGAHPRLMRAGQIKSEPGLQKKLGRHWIMAGIMCVMMLIGTTFALMSIVMPQMTNTFTFGKAGLTITEDFDPLSWDTKVVQLENTAGTGKVPGAVRAMIIPVLKSKDDENKVINIGGDLGALSKPVSNKIVMGDLTFVFDSAWETYWHYQDGYFYYRTILAVGGITEPLLDHVEPTQKPPSPAIVAKYADIDVEVEVMSDILQAMGNASQDAWGITIPII